MTKPETEKSEKVEAPKVRGPNGGKRPGSGRKRGIPNKSAGTLKEATAVHMPKVVARLLKIVDDDSAPAAARVAACRELLDRGFGKPTQTIEGTGNSGAIVVEIVRFGGGNAK